MKPFLIFPSMTDMAHDELDQEIDEIKQQIDFLNGMAAQYFDRLDAAMARYTALLRERTSREIPEKIDMDELKCLSRKKFR